MKPLIWHALKNPKAFLKQMLCRHKFSTNSLYWMGPTGFHKFCGHCDKVIRMSCMD